jgi:DNA topoisomerase-1
LAAIGHETQPPARFTEASLVKALESEGIGRPSTYANIIGTIIDRDYAHLSGNALIPTFTAFAVTTLLEKHFPDLVDTRFTARMEQTLDDISNGEAEWLPYLSKFYSGAEGLAKQVKEREDQIDVLEARTVDLEDLKVKVRIGRYGAYLEAEGEEGSIKASIPKDLTPADLSDGHVEFLLKQKTEGPDVVGYHPETGETIYAMVGPYGPYVQLGSEPEGDSKQKPKRASLPKGIALESVTLETAVGLLSLPRDLGTHPETEGKIQAGLGRFGPYVVYTLGKEKEYRSLKAQDDVLTIDLDRALELLAQPKRGRTNRGKDKTPLRELGLHPQDQEPINVYEGPYGPYIKHGRVNVSLPEGVTPEAMTLELALPLLDAKAGTKSRGKTGTKTKSTGKSTQKSTTKSTSKSGTKASTKSTAKSTSKSAAKKTRS